MGQSNRGKIGMNHHQRLPEMTYKSEKGTKYT